MIKKLSKHLKNCLKVKQPYSTIQIDTFFLHYENSILLSKIKFDNVLINLIFTLQYIVYE